VMSAGEPRRAEAQNPAPAGGARMAAADRYLPLVRRIAMKLTRSLPSTVAVEDIVAAGWVGLSEAIQRCPETMAEPDFEAYASYRVRGSILDYLRSLDPLTRKLRGAARRITQTITELTNKLGRLPDEDEVAGGLGVTLEVYRELLREIGEAGFARLELDAVDAGSPEPSPEAQVVKRDIGERIVRAIEALPERLQLVLGLVYQEECTLREVGAIIGVTESRACQLHAEATQLIRAQLEDPMSRGPSRPAAVPGNSSAKKGHKK
jgi:RNA polymerase sigma factor FliA